MRPVIFANSTAACPALLTLSGSSDNLGVCAPNNGEFSDFGKAVTFLGGLESVQLPQHVLKAENE